MKKENFEQLMANIRVCLAIEMLEYENKNYLAYDNQKRSKMKQALLQECINVLMEDAPESEYYKRESLP